MHVPRATVATSRILCIISRTIDTERTASCIGRLFKWTGAICKAVHLHMQLWVKKLNNVQHAHRLSIDRASLRRCHCDRHDDELSTSCLQSIILYNANYDTASGYLAAAAFITISHEPQAKWCKEQYTVIYCSLAIEFKLKKLDNNEPINVMFTLCIIFFMGLKSRNARQRARCTCSSKRGTYDYTCLNDSTTGLEQESWAIAEMTARCALCI